MEEPELARVTVRCSAEEADAAAAALWELAETGGRETATTAGAELEVWLPPDRAGDGAEIREGLRAAGVAATVIVRPEPAGWLDGQRRFHRAFAVGEALWLRPPWEPRRPGYADVQIDPGMAFGTGQHATTRGCLELLAERPGPGSLLDVGCGSGVLAIAARRLGFDPVHAVDHDPAAVAATARNARANGVGLIVGLRDLDRDRLPRADVLVANLTAALLERLAARIDAPGPGRAILSGIRPEEVDRTMAAFGRTGLRRERVLEDDGWAAVELVG